MSKVHPKVGFHLGAPCNECGGIETFFEKLQRAGVEFSVYSVSDGGIVAVDAKEYGATHRLFRNTGYTDYVPYTVDPAQPNPGQSVTNARVYWNKIYSEMPPEVRADKDIWLEIFNEPSKETADAEKVAKWQYHLALCALEDGVKLLTPAWSPGTPEPEFWQNEWAKKYLELCSIHPNQIGLTIHEGSGDVDDIQRALGWLVGRFHFIHDACDEYGYNHPTMFITEWGWAYDAMPEPVKAMQDIAWASEFYAPYPNIKGFFIWTLMGGKYHDKLSRDLNNLIGPIGDYVVNTTFEIDEAGAPPTPPPLPPPSTKKVLILDGSKWQHPLDPAEMKQNGVDGYAPRTTYGTWIDERVREHVPQLRDGGVTIPFTWHYYHPFQGWREQYDVMASIMRELGIKRAAIDLEDMHFEKAVLETAMARGEDVDPAILRVENVRMLAELVGFENNGPDGGMKIGVPEEGVLETTYLQPQLVADAEAFMNQLQLDFPPPQGWVGPWHGIYSNWSYWKNIMGAPEWGKKYFLWIAAWTTASAPAVPVPWSRWTVWQHSSNGDGRAMGVGSARVDLNRFNGTVSDYAMWVAPKQSEPIPVDYGPELLEIAKAQGYPIALSRAPLFLAIDEAEYEAVTSEATVVTEDGSFFTMQLGHDVYSGRDRVFYYKGTDYTKIDSYAVEDTVPPPPPPPPSDGDGENVLLNPTFNSENWRDAIEFSGQHPEYWTVRFNEAKNDVAPGQPPYGSIEGVHKGINELPPSEWDLFLWDEDRATDYCYKLFAPGPRPIWPRMKQVITNLKQAQYRLTVRVFDDCHRKVQGGGKDYKLETSHSQMMVKVNDLVFRNWTNLIPGQKNIIDTVINHTGGAFDLAVHFRANWGTENGWFLNDWELVEIGQPDPPVVDPDPEPPQPPPPQPPSSGTGPAWNLRPAFRPLASATGAYGPWMVLQHSDGSTEDTQHYVVGANTYLIKGQNYEHYIVSEMADGIFRDEDTSHGEKTFYRLRDENGAIHKWLPATMRVGEVYKRTAHVTLYNKDKCAAIHSYKDVTYAMLLSVEPTKVFGSTTVYNVATFIFGHNPSTIKDTWFEKTSYALGKPGADGHTDVRGLVEWQSRDGKHSWLSEVPQGRGNLPLNLICQ